MIKLILLGIVAITLFCIAPVIGASKTVTVDPDTASSPLLSRTIFDVSEEVEGKDAEELRERRERRKENGELEERRDDAERFFDNREE